MSRSTQIGVIVITVLTLVSAAFSQSESASPSAVSAGWAKVIEIKGEVQVQLPTQALVPASREMILPAGTSIQTRKGSAMLRLQDGSEVLVKGNSSVLLKSPEDNDHRYLEVLLGKIRAAVKKRLEGSPSFRLGTPTAVITVRGTKFDVTVDKKMLTEVVVYEGLVEVSGIGDSARPILLGPGFMITVPRSGIPGRLQRTIEGDDRPDRSGDDRFGGQSRSGQSDDRQQTQRTPSQPGGEHETPDN
jgi:hypothetical protein